MTVNQVFLMQTANNVVSFEDSSGLVCTIQALNSEGWKFVQAIVIRDNITDIPTPLAFFEKEKSEIV